MLASIILFALAAPAQAVGDSPATAEELTAAAVDCTKVVTPGKVDTAQLKALGWKFGGNQKRSVSGIPLEEHLFGREGGNVIEMIQITGGISATCTSVGRLTSQSEVTDLRQRLMAATGVVAFADYPGDAAFKASMSRSSPNAAEKILIGDKYRFTIMSDTKDGALIVKVMMIPKRSAK